MNQWMIYGAYGYTGKLVIEEAQRRGLRPLLAGRDREALARVARDHDLRCSDFSLSESFDERLRDVDLVLHCAGPFSKTSRPMVDACLRTGTHYLDVTGEIQVFEEVLARDAEARQNEVSLIPGVGFDVVPTDCLAARLAEELPEAVELELAISTRGGNLSRGTLRTMIEGLGEGGAIRRNGKIEKVPTAYATRDVPFESGSRTAMTIPWGDVSTAFHTTGIPNIRVYASTHPKTIRRIRRMRPLLPLVGLAPVQWLLTKLTSKRTGPDEEQRERSWIELWGEVTDGSGVKRSATMRVPDGYTFTAASAVLAVERVLAGDVDAGAMTPVKAFGRDFVDGVLERSGSGELST